jgi:hypothetical protein
MVQTQESPGTDSRAPSKLVRTTDLIVTRRLADWRSRRIRRWARGELNRPADPGRWWR